MTTPEVPRAAAPAAAPAPVLAPSSQTMLALSYLWILCVVPLLVESRDPTVRWHALHGLVLVIAEVVGFFALLLLGIVFGALLPPLVVAAILALWPVLWIGVVVLHAVLLVDALRGRRWRVPVITDYVERILGSDAAAEAR